MTSVLPVLYSFRRCPYAIRARLAISISLYQCRLREVVLRDKPDAMLLASPKATVPVLVQDDGNVIDESLDIMLLVLRINDPLNWLSPKQGSIETMFGLIEETETRFKPHLDQYKYSSRYIAAERITHRDAASTFLMEIETKLAGQDFLFGSQQSLADVAILPFIRQFAQTDRIWFDDVEWPNIHMWLQRFETSPLFTGVMTKHSVWRAGDTEPLFPN